MSGPASGAPRALRAGVFALAAVSLSLAAHTIAGGHAPDLLALLTAVVGVGCLTAAATARPIGRLVAVTGLAGMQVLLHVWFSLTGGHGCDVGGIVLSGHHHALAACAQGTGTAAATTATSPGLAAAVAMPLAHVGAVLLTALLLAHGDRALWTLAALARTFLAAAAPAPVPVTVPPARRAGTRPVAWTLPTDPVRAALGLRGPPRGQRG